MKRIYFLLFSLVISHTSLLRASECALDSLSVTVDHCDGDSFYVYVNFDFNEEVGETFKIRGNGADYGQFTYNQLLSQVGCP